MLKEILEETSIKIDVSNLNMIYKPSDITSLSVGMLEFTICIDGIESSHSYGEIVDNMGNDILGIIEILRNVYFNYEHKDFFSLEKYKIVNKREIHRILNDNVDGSFRDVNVGKMARVIESILDLDYFKELYKLNDIMPNGIQFLSSQVIGAIGYTEDVENINLDDFEDIISIEYLLSFTIKGNMKYVTISSGGKRTIYGDGKTGVFVTNTDMNDDDIDTVLTAISLIEYSMWNIMPRHIDLTINMDTPMFLNNTRYRSDAYEKSLVRALRDINRDVVHSNVYYQSIDDIMDFIVSKYRIYLSFNDVKVHPRGKNTMDISRDSSNNITSIKVRVYNEEFKIVNSSTLTYNGVDKNVKMSHDVLRHVGDKYPYHKDFEVERDRLNKEIVYVYSKMIIDLVDDHNNGTHKFKDTYKDYLHLLCKEDVMYVNKIVERINNGK